jgi:hypothetical protein
MDIDYVFDELGAIPFSFDRQTQTGETKVITTGECSRVTAISAISSRNT